MSVLSSRNFESLIEGAARKQQQRLQRPGATGCFRGQRFLMSRIGTVQVRRLGLEMFVFGLQHGSMEVSSEILACSL